MKCKVRALSALLLATLPLNQSRADPPFPCMLASASTPDRMSSTNNVALAPNPPNNPNVRPSILERPKPMIPLGCNRPFLYRGEIYSVDSPQAADAGNLKYFISDTALSQKYLDQYQDNRRKSRISAYTGTAGLFLALFSAGIGRWLTPRNPGPVATTSAILGGALVIEGISYSMSVLRQNESLLTEAVDAHNKDKPKDPVELQFSLGWGF
jgi:hypothetical protein